MSIKNENMIPGPLARPKDSSEKEIQSERSDIKKSPRSLAEQKGDMTISKENLHKWDRDSMLPPQMMKRWFGGGP